MQTGPVTISVDSYNFIHSLMDVGVSEQQAKAFLDNILKINLQNVASKDDVVDIKKEISRLDKLISEVKFDILKWMIPLFLGLYGFIAFKH